MITTSLIAGFLTGLLGSFHCIGMCGPIALSLPVHQHRGLVKFFLILSYNAGRMLTYAAYGAVAGLLGEVMVFATSGQILSIVAGSLIIISVLMARTSGPGFLNFKIFNKIQAAFSAMLSGRRKQSLFVIGLLNGLLPCGLVYMALALAVAGGEALSGAALMFMFGAGTLPVMLLLPYLGSFINVRMRNQVRKIVPYFIAATGVLLILRGLDLGIPFVSPDTGSAAPSCHTISSNDQINNIQCIGPASAHSK